MIRCYVLIVCCYAVGINPAIDLQHALPAIMSMHAEYLYEKIACIATFAVLTLLRLLRGAVSLGGATVTPPPMSRSFEL